MKTGVISVADNLFETLLAISHEEQEQGLMHVEPPTPVMSFIYSYPQINRFWMANTKAKLDIVFCCQGQITQICKGEPFSTSAIGGYKPSDLVVELPYGTIKSADIRLGDYVGFVSPTPDELKIIIAEKGFGIIKNRGLAL